MRKFAVLIATWFGSGLIPPPRFIGGMAGTYGSIATLPLCWLLGRPGMTADTRSLVWGLVLFVIFMLGLWSVPITEEWLGSRRDYQGNEKTRDQNQIVIDEVWGMIFACVPLYADPTLSFWWYIVACGAFRIFDIAKIYPARRIDQIPTVQCVMFDDMFAGFYAAGTVILLLHFFPHLF